MRPKPNMAERVGRGSLTGRWKPGAEASPNIRGGITIDRDLPAGTRLWLTGWTKTIVGGELVSVLVEIADKFREAVPDADQRCAPTGGRVSEDAMNTNAVGARIRSPSPAAERMRRLSQPTPRRDALSPHLVTRNASRPARSKRVREAGGPRQSRSTPTSHRWPHQHGLGRDA
jgi:hypothetical protein